MVGMMESTKGALQAPERKGGNYMTDTESAGQQSFGKF